MPADASGASLLTALALALFMGLRHASDPDHVIATALLVGDGSMGPRRAAGIGAWWGAGHAGALLALGIPLIVSRAVMPAWLERVAELGVGIVIVVLAARALLRTRGAGTKRASALPSAADGTAARTPTQAAGVGMLHGLAGTGAVVVLLLAAVPSQAGAVAALAVFAPMTAVSMAACTAGVGWVLTRGVSVVALRALAAAGLLFGLWFLTR